MADYDRLRGLSGQSMGGPKGKTTECGQYTRPGSYTFTAPNPGQYKFVLWGGGGAGSGSNGAGGSGAYCEYTRTLGGGEQVALVLGAKALTGAGVASTATFADGKVVSAGGGAAGSGTSGGAGGTASGGDVNLSGSAGGGSSTAGTNGGGTAGGTGAPALATAGGGGGAPANTPYFGGNGAGNDGASNAIAGTTPGGGGYGGATASIQAGSTGAIFVQLVKPQV